MNKVSCFAYKEKEGQKICTALKQLECDGCKFYHTKGYYDRYVKPLKYKKSGGG